MNEMAWLHTHTHMSIYTTLRLQLDSNYSMDGQEAMFFIEIFCVSFWSMSVTALSEKKRLTVKQASCESLEALMELRLRTSFFLNMTSY